MQNRYANDRAAVITTAIPMRYLRSAAALGLGAAMLALASCGSEIAPPFEIEGEGALEGFVFFDANRDGRYDPADGDFRLEGIQLEVRSRGTQGVFGGTQVASGEDGEFVIEGLPLGTHDLFVVPTSISPVIATGRICLNPIPVSIYRNETQFRPVAIQDVCLVPILEALLRGIGAERYQVRGIVTMAPGQGRLQGDDMYVQDSSTGVKIFGTGGWNVEIGDRIEFSARVDVFNQELQFVQPVLESVEPEVGAPAPVLLTTQQVADLGPLATHPQMGALAVIEGAEIMGGFAGRNVVVDDGSGPTEVRFEPGSFLTGSGFEDDFVPGSCWNFTGVIGAFNGVAQLKPRTAADITPADCPVED